MPDSRQLEGNATSTSSKSAAPDPLIGRVINGRFKIVSVIARGGMGKVYRAEQSPLGRICALKVLSPKYEGDRDPEFHKRFYLEASIASKLTHPNTVTVFDYGHSEEDDVYFIAMEYIEGKTLHRVLREESSLSEARASHVARQICRSLREAHGLGVVHRDLKPGNVLLVNHEDEHDNVKVLDFGLVKNVESGEDLTQQGLFMGSPKYMAPEQITGGEISARTDIYALGVMMYEMMAGKVPFDKGASVGTLMAHVHEAVPPMTVYNPDIVISAAMERVIYTCLEKDPDKRFGSMNELLAALKRTGHELSLSDTHESLPAITGPLSRSSRPSFGTGEYSAVTSSSRSGPVTYSGPIYTETSAKPSAPVFVTPPITDSMGPRPAPPPDQTTLQDLTRVPPRRVAPWAIAGVLAAGVGVAAILFSRGTPVPPPTPVATATEQASVAATVPTEAPSTAPSTETPPSPSIRIVRVDSNPPGASVYKGNKQLCSTTPCRINWLGDDAAATAKHDLVFELKGYKNATIEVMGSEENITVKLDPVPTGRSPGSLPKPPPTGYKKDPYGLN